MIGETIITSSSTQHTLPDNQMLLVEHDAIQSINLAWPTDVDEQQQQIIPSANLDVVLTDDEPDAIAAAAVEMSNHQLPSDKRKKKWRKPKDKPKRPLSAYNLFFQIERQRLLEEGGPAPELLATAAKGSKDKKCKKYGFAGLARHIASKWKDLDEDSMAYYQGLADKEQVRYMKDLVQWKIHEAKDKYDEPIPADDQSVTSHATTTTTNTQQPQAVPSPSWCKSSEEQHDIATVNHLTAARCMGDSLFGGFDDGSSNLTSIIQELAREQQATATTENQVEMMEPLPFTSPLEFGGSPPSMADVFQRITTSFAMPPPSVMSNIYTSNLLLPSIFAPAASTKPSPSLQQLRLDLDQDEQDFLIAFLRS
jgi:hypothetical protein